MIFSDMLSIICSWNKKNWNYFTRQSLVPAVVKKLLRTGKEASFVTSSNHTIPECIWCHIKTILLVVWLPGQTFFGRVHSCYFVGEELKKTKVNYLQTQNVLPLQWWQG